MMCFGSLTCCITRVMAGHPPADSRIQVPSITASRPEAAKQPETITLPQPPQKPLFVFTLVVFVSI